MEFTKILWMRLIIIEFILLVAIMLYPEGLEVFGGGMAGYFFGIVFSIIHYKLTDKTETKQ